MRGIPYHSELVQADVRAYWLRLFSPRMSPVPLCCEGFLAHRMSALGHKQTSRRRPRHVRFTPDSRHSIRRGWHVRLVPEADSTASKSTRQKRQNRPTNSDSHRVPQWSEMLGGSDVQHEAYRPVIEDGRGIFPEDLRVKAPRGSREAIAAAAQRKHTTKSEWI